LSAWEVANNLRIILKMLLTTINSSDSNDPAIKIIMEEFKDKFLEKVNLT